MLYDIQCNWQETIPIFKVYCSIKINLSTNQCNLHRNLSFRYIKYYTSVSTHEQLLIQVQNVFT